MKDALPPPWGNPTETSKTCLFPEEHLLCFEGWRDLEFWFPTIRIFPSCISVLISFT